MIFEWILPFVPLISVAIVSGLLVFAFINFSITRKNMQRQSEQQIANLKIQNEQEIYSRIIEGRLKLENTKEFTKWQAKAMYLGNDLLLSIFHQNIIRLYHFLTCLNMYSALMRCK